MSLTYSEIKQQYTALRQTYDYLLERKSSFLAFVRSHSLKSITVIGCGSGYCLSRSAAFSLGLRSGVPAVSLAGGDLMLNGARYASLLQDTLLVAPSRSGSTSEIVEAVKRVQAQRRVPVLSIACVPDSPLSKVADYSLELPWAFDSSVCQTRTVTNLYAANLILSAFLNGDDALLADIDAAIAQGEAYMARVESDIRRVSSFAWTQVVVLADGELHGLATEGAIAVTEIANAQAHAHHLLDVRHGPMVTIKSDTLVVAALTNTDADYQRKLMQDIKKRGATIIAYTDQDESGYAQEVDLLVTSGRKLDTAVHGIPFIFIPQIVALGCAERLGINPDSPDGLDAWVKL